MRTIILATAASTLLACAHAAPLPPQAIALNRDGAAAMAMGDLVTAEARIALALEYNPKFTEAWVNLGYIDLQTGNFDRARRDFVKARDLNPDLPTPHHGLGLLSDREAHYCDAERYYRAALKVDPGFAPARINLVRRLFERGAYEEAREHALRLTQVAPEFIEGWAFLCETLLKLRRTAEAEIVLGSAHQLFGAHPALELLDARVLIVRGDFEEADEKLASLVDSRNPEQAASALAWRAIAQLGEGEADAAVASAKRASVLAPDDSVVRYALSAIASTKNRSAE
jgi:Flp pilus assembly protein TadD